MPTVRIDILPSTEQDVDSLEIYEAVDPESGPWVLIDTITPVGTYPTYITVAETENALSLDNWFAIQWTNNNGWESGLSEAVQGRTSTLIGKVVSRVMMADPNLNENIVAQAAEFIVSEVMKTDDPYDTTLAPTYKQLAAMTLLTQAHALVRTMASSSGQSSGWTAGLVSMKSATDPGKNSKDIIDYLMETAAGYLGIQVGVIAQMVVPEIAGGLSEIIREDVSRLELVEEL